MAPIEILKFPISSPGDISPLKKLQDAGYDPSNILAVVGKTEGARLDPIHPLQSIEADRTGSFLRQWLRERLLSYPCLSSVGATDTIGCCNNILRRH